MKIILDYAADTERTTKAWREGMLLFGISDKKMRLDQAGGVSTVFDIGDGGYTPPVGGIPLEDLEVPVQNLLELAGTALQSFTETDPTVPAWAKEVMKPTYTASEVGAATAEHTHSDKANDADVVKLTGNQTIEGIKTFTSAVKVPDKTTAAANDGTLVATEAQVFAVSSLVGNLEFVKNVAYNDVNGDVTFTYKDNSTLTINVFAENLAQDIEYDAISKELVITKRNGATQRISVADLVDIYTGHNGTHIQVTVGSGNVISAVLKAGTVSETELTSALLGKINGALQSFTETDPTVPAWAKGASKPTYTASEVGAAAASHTHTKSQVTDFAHTHAGSDVTSAVANATTAASCTGNAATATKLQTARTIGGVSFDGSANINLPGVNAAGNQNTTGTATNATNLTGNVSVTLGTTESTTKFGTAAISQTLSTWLLQIGQRINGIIQALSGKLDVTATAADSAKLGGKLPGEFATAGQGTKADTALQSFTETDPTVPAWAKAASKPTYTASEVGAAAASHTHTKSQVTDFAHTHAGSDITSAVANATTAASCTGNAATATKLQTARTIGGVSFDGSANINLPGVNAAGNQNTTGTATNATNLTGNVSVTLGSTESTAKFGTTAISQTLATWLQQIGQRVNGIIQALGGKQNAITGGTTDQVLAKSSNTDGAFKWVAAVSLNRTVGGNDNATGTITDTGGNISVPIPVTVTAGSESSTLPTSASAMSLRSWLTTIRNNVLWLINRAVPLSASGSGGRVLYSPNSATAPQWNAAPGTSNKILISQANAAPIWLDAPTSGKTQILLWNGSSFQWTDYTPGSGYYY